jgi:hypothetical protein
MTERIDVLIAGDPNLRIAFDGDRLVVLVGWFQHDDVVDVFEVQCEHELSDMAGAVACAAMLRLDGEAW